MGWNGYSALTTGKNDKNTRLFKENDVTLLFGA